ncbi:YbhB/YbcL family Raf kinase inhibitor-like protein [Paenibacillus sp. GCM10027628]|uniref:YbhB/YbcL family Raf kinase inhibitor-like protein n=1 Tax=Paenibacillus sp. GCM10027628 TaxID=3273413 RepID=UPI00363E8356
MMSNKRRIRFTCALVLLLPGLLPAYASAETNAPATPVPQKDVMSNVSSFLKWNTPITITLDGNKLPVQGVMTNTEILVPLRAVSDAIGNQITWDTEANTAHLSGSGYTISQHVGEATAIVNGISYELDHEATIMDGRLMVSARILPLALGLELRWDSSSRTLSLSSRHGEGGIQLQSAAFTANGDIPVKYAHGGVAGGQNISMPVSWSHAPEGTKSFAVVMYDLHPIADNYIHWSVIDIPAGTKELKEGAAGSLPAGKELNAYFGMEPPRFSGDHLYRLAVYALDTEKLDVGRTPSFFEELEPLLLKHSLAYSELDGFFKQ